MDSQSPVPPPSWATFADSLPPSTGERRRNIAKSNANPFDRPLRLTRDERAAMAAMAVAIFLNTMTFEHQIVDVFAGAIFLVGLYFWFFRGRGDEERESGD